MFGTQLLGAAARNHSMKKRKEFGVGLNDTHFVNYIFCIQPCSRTHAGTQTHTWLTADEHVALRGKWGSTHVLLVSLQAAFPALLLLHAQGVLTDPPPMLFGGLALREHPGDHAGGLPGEISRVFSHGLPCYRTRLYPWQVYSTIKPRRDLRDHLGYKSAPLIHLVLG